MSIRSFVAIELPDDVARGLGRTVDCLRALIPGSDIKWVASGNIHVTLKFLGDVRIDRLEEVQRALEMVCAAASPMQLTIEELGAFPSPRAPRIIWAGLKGDIEQLASLARAIDEALEPLGFARESRPFTPHLTLARVRDEASHGTRAALSDALAGASVTGNLAVEAVAASLMESQLTPRGAVYSRVAHLPMGSCR